VAHRVTITENEKGLDPYLINALGSRGVSQDQHETKMRNLRRISAGGVRILALSHDCYRVDGMAGTYNPHTDTWDSQ
jgi:hypothetical protein